MILVLIATPRELISQTRNETRPSRHIPFTATLSGPTRIEKTLRYARFWLRVVNTSSNDVSLCKFFSYAGVLVYDRSGMLITRTDRNDAGSSRELAIRDLVTLAPTESIDISIQLDTSLLPPNRGPFFARGILSHCKRTDFPNRLATVLAQDRVVFCEDDISAVDRIRFEIK